MVDEMQLNLSIRQAEFEDIPKLWDMALAMGSAKRDGYFDRSLEYQAAGKRYVFIASIDREDVGYCMLAFHLKYAFFRKMNVPEIQDLNVLPPFRRRGIARALILHCETLALHKGVETIGIGVGMDPSYGVAQRLYVRLGYVPDGNGLTYDRRVISKGDFRPVDDDMSLMLIKDLQK